MTRVASRTSLRPCSAFMYFLLSVSSFVTFSKLRFLILFLLVSLFGSEDSICDGASSFENHSLQNSGLVWNRRVVRSPFLPPTVTSFKPSVRRGSKRQDLKVRAGEPILSALPPLVSGQAAATKQHAEKDAPILHGRVPVKSTFSRPPMVLHQFVKDKEESPAADGVGPSILPQNDQHSLAFVKEDKVSFASEPERHDQENQSKIDDQQTINNEPEFVSKNENDNPQEIFRDYHRALKLIGKTSEQLQEILAKEGIAMDNFLGFIHEGVTETEVLKFLQLSNPSIVSNLMNKNKKNSKLISFSVKQNKHKSNLSKIKSSDSEIFPKYEKENPQEILMDYHRVLKVINKDTEQLQGILEREEIPLDNFLGFIDEGVTKDEVLKFLNLSKSSKISVFKHKNNDQNPKPIPFSVRQGHHERASKKISRQKVLSELPFTEIVHEIPIEREKSFEIHRNYSSYKRKLEDYNNKKGRKKWNKKLRERNFKEVIYSSTPNKIEHEKENSFLMNSDYDTILPPKDSPIITPFLPSRRKERNKDSASIISLTVEEAKEKNNKQPDSVTQWIPVRSKVLSMNEERKPSTNPGPTKQLKKSSFEHQQSNLRLVFPMRGILLFCGSLGVISVVTIIILIIYGAVKCNRKTDTNSYQMGDRPDISTS